MYLRFKRFVASNQLFWRYRHLFQKIEKSYGVVKVDNFNKIFNSYKIKSVLDFGCATGDKLVYFIKKGSNTVCGVDVNPKAIKVAEEKIRHFNINYKFFNKIDLKKINFFFKKKFDLSIIDRVLYILNEEDLSNCIKKISKISNYIYIDDFFLNNNNNNLSVKNIKGYVHRDFDKILKKNKFKLILKKKSPYKKVLFASTKQALYKYMQ